MVPKIVVVTARLLEYDPDLGEDTDQAVLAFLVRLRTEEAGLVEGVEVSALSAKLGAAMDHGVIRFNGVLVPADALLTGDWGHRDADGRFVSAVAVRQRFHRTIRPLQGGRLDLATSSQAAIRATVAALVNHKAQRPHGDSDDVQRDLATVAAHAYAGSVLGRLVRDMAARSEDLTALWFMVVKPILTAGAEQILLTCRRLAGAQGHLRVNYIPDSLANVAGAGTAEGDNRVLLIAAGRAGRTLSLLTLDGTLAERPWWLERIVEREEILGTDLCSALGADQFEPDGLALGRDSAQVDLAQTTGVRLLVTAALIAAESMTDPDAAALARSAAAVVALQYLYEHSGWYNARGLQTPQQAQQVLAELREHRLALANHLPVLVAGFDIPVLPGAPIFAPDYLESVADWTGWGADSFPRRR
jgi:acyl-CoA oxidase